MFQNIQTLLDVSVAFSDSDAPGILGIFCVNPSIRLCFHGLESGANEEKLGEAGGPGSFERVCSARNSVLVHGGIVGNAGGAKCRTHAQRYMKS